MTASLAWIAVEQQPGTIHSMSPRHGTSCICRRATPAAAESLAELEFRRCPTRSIDVVYNLGLKQVGRNRVHSERVHTAAITHVGEAGAIPQRATSSSCSTRASRTRCARSGV